jgi:hypothetical protein
MAVGAPDSQPDRPLGRRRVTVGVVVVVAVVVAAAALVGIVLHRHHAAPPPPARAAAPTASPPASPAHRPPSSATPQRKPSARHDYVPAAAPYAFTLAGRAFTIRARVCGMPYVRPLDPPGEQHHTVCWVRQGFGVAPGSASATTYVLGHAWAQDPREVLNRASSPATREVLAARPRMADGIAIYPVRSLLGYRLTLRTANGTLTYVVRTAYGVRKADAGNYPHLMDERIRNRVVVITCAERGGVDYDYNIVLEAYLTSSQRADTRA